MIQTVATGTCQLEFYLPSESEALDGSKYPRILGRKRAG